MQVHWPLESRDDGAERPGSVASLVAVRDVFRGQCVRRCRPAIPSPKCLNASLYALSVLSDFDARVEFIVGGLTTTLVGRCFLFVANEFIGKSPSCL